MKKRPILFLILLSIAQFIILLSFHYFKVQSLLTSDFKASLAIMIGFLTVVYATGLFLYNRYISKVLQYIHFFNLTSTVAVIATVLYSGFVSLYLGRGFITVAGSMMQSVLLTCIFSGAFVSAMFAFLMRTMFKDQKKDDVLDKDFTGMKNDD